MSAAQRLTAAGAALAEGRARLGIELGSTRIKAVILGADETVIATGSATWENQYVDRVWTYSLDAVWEGLQEAYATVCEDAVHRHGVRPTSFAAMGVSAMMHGYLAFDEQERLLVPFRTWRNTSTAAAAAELTELLGHNIPLRWSVAHLYQAVLDAEPHVPHVRLVTTLAGYVHWRLTGRRVLGVGDASGMFPIDPVTHGYDREHAAEVDRVLAGHGVRLRIAEIFPEPLDAGRDAGVLTPQGAARLDPSGRLEAGVPLCPPEGDAGTGMVATNSVSPRSGNVSVGTSIFAMVVLEHPLIAVHPELDLVTTPTGDQVAMVHCNNGASELGAWAGVFGEFATALGGSADPDAVFAALLEASLDGQPDAGGLIAYNTLSGEPITGLDEGRPLVVRTPDSRFTLANFVRAQVYGVFATLSLGMRVLRDEDVALDTMYAHGGVFRTAGVAQRFLAAAIGTPVAVSRTAGEGGAWGAAVLASYLANGAGRTLGQFLSQDVFGSMSSEVVTPDPVDTAGYEAFLNRYEAGLAVERAAVGALR
ncbi:FGGY-family carbohydrate kinase [Brooklawnia cerclae]|uniref:Sugar (Pentulose or hexulose) kinase n=1 Tax=Brooklawnia cerclae TaxID=349934 RepID=A0ABX0SFG9_9ACTN|nr:FGGY-family carbohydrate kinase [Brooklawnia cerclae]NIH57148.1 sugar (pentulose or hexulose) kinase [Brooklawnia cerclae]